MAGRGKHIAGVIGWTMQNRSPDASTMNKEGHTAQLSAVCLSLLHYIL